MASKNRPTSTVDVYEDPLDDFVTPERCWFDYKYESKLGYRHMTFKRAFQEALRHSDANRVFVETGCVRELNDYSAGYSTYLMGELLSWYGGRLYTVDLQKRHMNLCRSITTPFAKSITYTTMDSVRFLKNWSRYSQGQKIDLLYLDSYDYPVFPRDGTSGPPQEHCLAELNAALPHLHQKSVVLIDDGALPGGGKPRLAKLRLAELGWTCLVDDYQTLWQPG